VLCKKEKKKKKRLAGFKGKLGSSSRADRAESGPSSSSSSSSFLFFLPLSCSWAPHVIDWWIRCGWDRSGAAQAHVVGGLRDL